ncbi:DUF2584 domain-containing protein [Bacillus solimangrovi]|uniref:DUF2584 domain-containing protein n=1 Tax=Bacillus solimangrovi TaxID=1305675 RepID=A0A1E5LIX1_9BACI|nr:DUF2584 domain-containing protein [Bacillus solimangrovi]OEH94039.1 hypothetical protein BFG57_10360 [Bacillus solimangrovi]
MGMPLELITMIVTNGNAKRVEANTFELTKEGYRLYPIDVQLEVRKSEAGEASGQAIIRKIMWENNQTTLIYDLTSLHSPN